MLAKWEKRLKDRKMNDRKMLHFSVIHFSVKIFLPKKQGFHLLGTKNSSNFFKSTSTIGTACRNFF